MLALRLALVGLAAVALLEGLHRLTAPAIEAAQRERERQALSLALPADQFDNAIESDRIAVRAPRWLGSEQPLTVHRAELQGRPSGFVIEAVAAAGYGGPIRMLVGIDGAGRVQGVRLLEHRETPGLGDYVDARRSDWPESLRGRSLRNPPPAQWRVEADGGRFPYLAGATVSPRAVVDAVRVVLQFAKAHGPALRAAAAGTTLEFTDGPEPLPRADR
nr:RnfABCDGE type electron transport complex subunit G [Lysobacter sp. CAU 1642]